MYRSRWTTAFFLAVLLAFLPTGSFAGLVEVVVVECNGQTTTNDCGFKFKATGEDATFTTPDGQVIDVPAGVTLSVSGAGIISQSTDPGPLANFASADSGPETTATIGAGSGSGGQTNSSQSGGSNSGPPPSGNPPVNTNQFTFTSTTSGASNSVSP
jgi:hypothetical protein